MKKAKSSKVDKYEQDQSKRDNCRAGQKEGKKQEKSGKKQKAAMKDGQAKK